MGLTKELIHRSKSWTQMTQVREVLRDACEFLEYTSEIEAGYFLYYHKEVNQHLEYSWGLQTPQQELHDAIYTSVDYLPVLSSTQGYWMSLDEAPLYWREILRKELIVQAAGWLISVHDDVVGVFVLGRRCLTDFDDEMTELSMAHICLMVEMIIHRQAAEQASLRDPLTGLLNRRGFMREFERMVSEVTPRNKLLLVVLDIDELKQVNDQHGHLVGDDILRQVGNLLQVRLSQHPGICGRYGGDEFTVLLKLETDNVGACENTISVWFENSSVQLSVGCAELGRDGDDFETCFRIADQRMYERKTGLPS